MTHGPKISVPKIIDNNIPFMTIENNDREATSRKNLNREKNIVYPNSTNQRQEKFDDKIIDREYELSEEDFIDKEDVLDDMILASGKRKSQLLHEVDQTSNEPVSESERIDHLEKVTE